MIRFRVVSDKGVSSRKKAAGRKRVRFAFFVAQEIHVDDADVASGLNLETWQCLSLQAVCRGIHIDESPFVRAGEQSLS